MKNRDTFVFKMSDFKFNYENFEMEKISKKNYTFRGKANIQKVILDALNDKKIGFIVIEKNHFRFGITHQYSDYIPLPPLNILTEELTVVTDHIYGFLISAFLPKEHISKVIKLIEDYKKQVDDLPKRITKEIRKNNQEMDKKRLQRHTVTVKVF